jgi:hypothetical protein
MRTGQKRAVTLVRYLLLLKLFVALDRLAARQFIAD